jgi:hypothetical protein
VHPPALRHGDHSPVLAPLREVLAQGRPIAIRIGQRPPRVLEHMLRPKGSTTGCEDNLMSPMGTLGGMPLTLAAGTFLAQCHGLVPPPQSLMCNKCVTQFASGQGVRPLLQDNDCVSDMPAQQVLAQANTRRGPPGTAIDRTAVGRKVRGEAHTAANRGWQCSLILSDQASHPVLGA